MRLQSPEIEIVRAVDEYYLMLYRFALNLSNSPADASDLTQQTFYIAQIKGHQLRDRAKLKTWLSTTLRRLFLQGRRHAARFPKCELAGVTHELPFRDPDGGMSHDAAAARVALGTLAEHFRRPLEMFYLEDRSYRQIASALGIPLGTVMSRLSRGKRLLRDLLEPANNVARN
jgi:RNA polymerase sigma-70 factor (ECF subfamily)